LPKRRRDEWAKLVSGQLGVSAVIVNVLIDKGVVSRDELCDRFRQAQGAAARSLGGQPAARTLAAMISYLEKVDRGPSH
jgi:hypothetical protein